MTIFSIGKKGDPVRNSESAIQKRKLKWQNLSNPYLNLARTVVALGGSETIQPPHLAEALQYRPKLMVR